MWISRVTSPSRLLWSRFYSPVVCLSKSAFLNHLNEIDFYLSDFFELNYETALFTVANNSPPDARIFSSIDALKLLTLRYYPR